MDHAGELVDTPVGRAKYLECLAWLSEDEPARKAQRFAEMSKGWLIGTPDFAKSMIKEHQELVGQGAGWPPQRRKPGKHSGRKR